jgi:hypothetical protein
VTAGPASRREHVRFCEVEGWAEVRNARGKAVRHHLTFELLLPSGNVLRTRISRPANAETYGPSLWSAILSTQLCVTENEFWACVDKGLVPPREGPVTTVPATAIPAGLAYQLIHAAGLSDAEVAAMTRDEAIARMNAYWSQSS